MDTIPVQKVVSNYHLNPLLLRCAYCFIANCLIAKSLCGHGKYQVVLTNIKT